MRILIFALAFFLLAAQAPAAPDDGLTAYYPFDGSAADISGNGHDGTIVGSVVPAPDRFGNVGHAYHFSGHNSYISVPAFLLPATGAFTFSAWVCPWEGLWCNDYRVFTFKTGTTQFALGMIQVPAPSGEVNRVISYFHSSARTQMDTLFPIVYGEWYLLTASYDGQYLRSYVNGIPLGKLRTTQTSSWTAPLYLGGSPEDVFFFGVIDDCRVYSRALADAEVVELYAADADHICQIGFSDNANGPWNITEFASDNTLHINVRDLNIEDGTDRIQATLLGLKPGRKGRAPKGRVVKVVNLTLDDQGYFKGSVSLSGFAPGKVAVMLSGRANEGASLSRQSHIIVGSP